MTDTTRPRDPRPLRPDPSECCGSGCIPCILEVYEDELERWKEREARRQQQAEQNKNSADNTLSG